MNYNDILIIGGGIIGVSAAYALAREGVSVTLIEKGELCTGSSHGNAGMVCPCHSTPIPGPGVLWQGIKWMTNPESPFYIRPRYDPEFFAWLLKFRQYCNETAYHRAIPPLREMQRASLPLYQEWIARENLACDFEKVGGLELFLTHEKHEAGRHHVDEMRAFGLDMEWLDRDATHALEPAARPEVIGGIHYKEDAHVNPAKFVHGLAEVAQRLGAQIVTKAQVLGFTREGTQIKTVRTSKGTFQPQQVVLAAGAWTPLLAQGLGIELPLQAAKGYSVTMNRPPISPRIPLHLAEARMAVTPMGALLRYAGTLELSGISTTINERRVDAIRRGAARYLVDSTPREEIEVWSGMRPVAPDGLPYIGRSRKVSNLIVATGHAMLGVSMGPVTGKVVSELVRDVAPSVELGAFGVERFQ
ncbi:MAG: FAD-dependent oxidoreductase [Anaerolineales bacterium]|nr:FAD-dependent oxidoreductase [Anaerolineales bacterium]